LDEIKHGGGEDSAGITEGEGSRETNETHISRDRYKKGQPKLKKRRGEIGSSRV